MAKGTQCERVLSYMLDFGSITQYEAMQDLGVMRLASRISDLKKLGYPIRCEMIQVKNRYEEKCWVKRYHLEVPADG